MLVIKSGIAYGKSLLLDKKKDCVDEKNSLNLKQFNLFEVGSKKTLATKAVGWF